ncbi:MAG: hypothetical protein KA821_10665 [Chitinophagaceae bacterium]|nr:hypothetical protein [Chitinophagaceae bacterium]
MNYLFLLIPLLTVAGCWSVVFFTEKILLYPTEPRSVLGFRVQGLLHRYRPQLIDGLAARIQTAFDKMEGLEARLTDPENFSRLKPTIEEHIDDFLRNKLKEQMPMISMFIGDKTVNTLKTIFIAEIEKLFPRVIGQYAGNLKKDLQLGKLVKEKLEAVSPAEINNQLVPLLHPAFVRLGRAALLIGLFTALLQTAVYLLLLA